MAQDQLRAAHIHQRMVPGKYQVLRPIGVAHQVHRQRGTLPGMQITLQHLPRHLAQFMPVHLLAAVLVQDDLGLGGGVPDRWEQRQRALDTDAGEPVEDGRSGYPLAEPICVEATAEFDGHAADVARQAHPAHPAVLAVHEVISRGQANPAGKVRHSRGLPGSLAHTPWEGCDWPSQANWAMQRAMVATDARLLRVRCDGGTRMPNVRSP